MCQLIPEYLYSLSPAIALYQALDSIIFAVVPPTGKYKQPEYHWVKCYNGNLCACGPFCDRVFYPRRPLVPLLEV
jgi:hypothetical protein